MSTAFLRLVLAGGLLLAAIPLRAAEPKPELHYEPMIAAASEEGEQAISGFRLPEGMTISLWAAEPMFANPCTFCIDERGRIYVAETFRQQKGVEDNRHHMDWLDDDLALQTVEERLAMFQKFLGDKVQEYTKEHDQIRLLEDRDGNGVADHSSLFAGGFNGILDGTGAGLLARRGNVYFTCIPDLYLLRDVDGDGRAEVRQSLHHGYGVRVAFRGHDLHGLRIGPDGKLYFSIGDRGYHIETKGRVLHRPYTGAVFRCNLDGSELEEFATGLRNPQELVFDDYGNLFTGDNNSDSGDQARWVYVVEGADIGWRMYYQYLPDRGPWNREKLWHPQHEGQAAYITPPIIHLADGPSGLTYYPGVGLPERYKGHFFLADFRGSKGNSGIRSFAVQPKGASFELVDSHEFLWSILATDVEFGYDGGMYISDWVDGWNGPGKGRIYKAVHPEAAQNPAIAEGKTLMAEGFVQRPAAELAQLLRHPDQRIRQEAQFALAERDETQSLITVARNPEHLFARLHAIWGLGQIGTQDHPEVGATLIALLNDSDSEVCAQAAKTVGQARITSAGEPLIPLLQHAEARVRFFAAQSLGKVGTAAAIPALIAMLEENADQDVTLRHAGVMGLAGIGDVPALLGHTSSPLPAVRLAVLLALRRLSHPSVAIFLNDTDPRLVDEAARAVHDLPLNDLYPQLAGLTSRSVLSDSTWRRVVNANYRLGKPEHAVAIAAVAGRADVPEAIRLEALQCLMNWEVTSGRDRVLGDWRPLPKRDRQPAAAALPAVLAGIFSGSDAVRQVGAQAAARLGVKEVGPALFALLTDKNRPGASRAEAVGALRALQDARLKEVIELALADEDAAVRIAGRQALVLERPEAALPELSRVLEEGTTPEQQAAFPLLADLKQPAADDLLAQWMDRLLLATVPPRLQLDLLEAARRRDVPMITSRLLKHELARSEKDPIALYREALEGGNSQRGRTIFLERAQVSCVRCHKVGGQGGEVGPDLTKLGREKTRAYLLEALVAPSQQIAKGFESVIIVTTDGRLHNGIVKAEGETTIQLINVDGKLTTLRKSDIEERVAGKSAMSEDLLKHLSKSDVRDLVEFLATLPLSE